MNEELAALCQELELSKAVHAVIQKIETSLRAIEIKPNDLQWRILANHVNEMFNRAKEGTGIPEIDGQLFSGISETSMQLAEEVVTEIGHLSPDEKYLLSIHFESAKEN